MKPNQEQAVTIKTKKIKFDDFDNQSELLQVISSAKEVDVLVLSEIELSKKKLDELLEIFQAIPESITELNLSYNYFGNMPVEELVQLFKSIPGHIQTLDLSANFLGKNITIKEFGEIIDAISSNITEIRITLNSFHRLHEYSDNKIADLGNILLNSKRTIKLDTNAPYENCILKYMNTKIDTETTYGDGKNFTLFSKDPKKDNETSDNQNRWCNVM